MRSLSSQWHPPTSYHLCSSHILLPEASCISLPSSQTNTVLLGLPYPSISMQHNPQKSSGHLLSWLEVYAKPRDWRDCIVWHRQTKTPSCMLFFFYWIIISRHVLLKSSMAGSHTPSLSTTCISNYSLQSQEDSSQYQNFKLFSGLLARSLKKFCLVNQQGCRRKPWYELRKDDRNKPESLNDQLPNPDNIFMSICMIAIVITL